MVRLATLLALALLALPMAATAQCRLALALALDVSSSVDAREYDLQRLGLAAALDQPEIRHAILAGQQGHVALAVYEWSGFHQHKLHLDWTVMRSHADIDRAVLALGRMTRSHDNFPTAVGQALGYGASLMRRAPADCTRRVIDLSGDGVNNYGYGPAAAYRNFPFDGVTVNGLVILGTAEGVLEFYHTQVARGPSAFVEVANGFDDFQTAMTRKLYREINDLVLGTAPPAPQRPRG